MGILKDWWDSQVKQETDRGEITNKKKQILDKFEIKLLKRLCKDYLNKDIPDYIYEDTFMTPITGEKDKVKTTRERIVRFILNSSLTIYQISDFAEKNRIRIDLPDTPPGRRYEFPETMREDGEKEEVSKSQSKLDKILSDIKNNFDPEDVRDEKDFKLQLIQFLKRDYKVDKEVPTPKGKIDLVIDRRYAIELKIAENKDTLRNLVGQLGDYKKIYGEIASIILDVGKMSYSEIKEYIDEYQSRGIKTLILRGKKLGGHKRGGKSINIKVR